MGQDKGDDAGLPKGTLNNIIGILARTNRDVFATLQALAEEENASTDTTTTSKGHQIEDAFKAVKASASAAGAQGNSLAKACSVLRSDLQKLKRAYGPKKRRIKG